MTLNQLAVVICIGAVPCGLLVAGESASMPDTDPTISVASVVVAEKVTNVLDAKQDLRMSFSRARVVTSPHKARFLTSTTLSDIEGRAFVPFDVRQEKHPDSVVLKGCYYPSGQTVYLHDASIDSHVVSSKHRALATDAILGQVADSSKQVGDSSRCTSALAGS